MDDASTAPELSTQGAGAAGAGRVVLAREERFEAALSCREEGKGVKPRQGCASVQLNRECKEGTRTPEFIKFVQIVRTTADAEVEGQFGTNAGSFDRADFLKVERPLYCTSPPLPRPGAYHGGWAVEASRG